MIRLAVINLKTLVKRVLKMILILLILAMLVKFSKIVYQALQKWDTENFAFQNPLNMIENNLVFSQSFEKDTQHKTSEWKKILVAELAVFSGAEEEIMERENQEEVIDFPDLGNQPISEESKEEENISTPDVSNPEIGNVQTSIIEANNKKDVFTDTYQNVKLKNESKYPLTQEMLTPDIKFKDTKNIVIYHTHTCESYTPTESSQYVSTGNYRTTDLNHSVASVGTELSKHLTSRGYNAIQDTTYHDYPAYTGSYTRSLATVQKLLSAHPSVDCVLDIHRDALRK